MTSGPGLQMSVRKIDWQTLGNYIKHLIFLQLHHTAVFKRFRETFFAPVFHWTLPLFNIVNYTYAVDRWLFMVSINVFRFGCRDIEVTDDYKPVGKNKNYHAMLTTLSKVIVVNKHHKHANSNIKRRQYEMALVQKVFTFYLLLFYKHKLYILLCST